MVRGLPETRKSNISGSSGSGQSGDSRKPLETITRSSPFRLGSTTFRALGSCYSPNKFSKLAVDSGIAGPDSEARVESLS
ncbi:hypothetical protein HZH68_011546 [Vespula germanica]|uniref:Uncharacterized protein n=2 Tax=Vespula TaxID=7451 RepID=A0A834JNR3_VESGE|nr:hypothetical protein HZH68_011546 [Vespula germanica]KAF7415672.1 hypothetical protein H0235_012264 [Vespula pensylvanica]